MTGGEPPFLATYLSKFYTIPVKMCCWMVRTRLLLLRFVVHLYDKVNAIPAKQSELEKQLQREGKTDEEKQQ